jgi:molybdopterin-guanine dinucleotide biosynthesis protein A
MAQRVGVVLAGGTGSRLGRTKGDLVVNGSTLAERAARALGPACATVLVSVTSGTANPAPAYPAVEDPDPPGRGPLAGIDAAFGVTGNADLVVLACDYPRIDSDVLKILLAAARDEDEIVLFTDGHGRDHPLVALWRRAAATHVRDALDQGLFKVRGLLGDLEARRVGPPDAAGLDLDRALLNVNSREDLASLDL